MNIVKQVYGSFASGLKSNPTTTIFGLLIASFTGLAQVDQLKEYSTIFSCGAGICTALLAVCASDAKKDQGGGS